MMLRIAMVLITVAGLGGCEKLIHDKVAKDSVDGYQLALKGGDRAEICLHAGLVVAAYNQAKDEENYLAWKKVERKKCAYLGF